MSLGAGFVTWAEWLDFRNVTSGSLDNYFGRKV